MPTPNSNESHDDFIKRCVPIVIDDGTAKDGKQGRAVCESIWRKNMSDIFVPANVKFQDEAAREGLRLAEIQIFKRGKFKHFLGEFKLGKKEFEAAIKNFNAGVPAREIALNFQHAADHPDPEIAKAAGWMGIGRKGSEMFFNRDGLFVKAFLTEKAAEFVEREEFLFSSAEFVENFVDESDEEHGFAVTGLALTNIPFLRNMRKNKLLKDFAPQQGVSYWCTEEEDSLKVYQLIEDANMEIKEFLELSGKETAEDALAFFKQLKLDAEKQEEEPEPEPEPEDDKKLSTAVYNLQATVKNLQAQLAVKDDAIKEATEFNQKQTLKDREAVLVRFFDQSKIDAGQLEKAKAAWVEIEPDQVKETEAGYRAQVEFIESSPVRQDLKDLTEDKGNVTGPEGLEPSDPMEAVVFHANRLVQEGKAKTKTEAQEIVFTERPDLKKAYEEASL